MRILFMILIIIIIFIVLLLKHTKGKSNILYKGQKHEKLVKRIHAYVAVLLCIITYHR